MEIIRIKNLKASIYLGVYDIEQLAPRPVIINLTLYADLKKACQSDNLIDTIDYHTLSEKILNTISPNETHPHRYQLIERVAEEIAEIALTFDKRIKEITVTVTKPNAFPEADAAEVEIHRSSCANGARK